MCYSNIFLYTQSFRYVLSVQRASAALFTIFYDRHVHAIFARRPEYSIPCVNFVCVVNLLPPSLKCQNICTFNYVIGATWSVSNEFVRSAPCARADKTINQEISWCVEFFVFSLIPHLNTRQQLTTIGMSATNIFFF